jgi:hypothetical protein
MKYLVALLLITSISSAYAADAVPSADYEAALREANVQEGLIAQRAQALAAQLSHANDTIASLTSQLAEARKAAAPSSPAKDAPKQ